MISLQLNVFIKDNRYNGILIPMEFVTNNSNSSSKTEFLKRILPTRDEEKTY